jgi:hypothetical protein
MMRREQIQARYPHLLSMMMWACSLSITEAVSCVQLYLDGSMFAGEAVNHMGGTIECVRHTAQCRNHFAHMGATDTYASILHRADFCRRIAA